MHDANDIAERYVAVWNETDLEQRRRQIYSLWADNGIEYTKSRLTSGYAALETRITASHEKNVRDSGNKFVLHANADRNHDVIKLNWQMLHVPDRTVKATGSYYLVLDDEDRILRAYFFADP